MPLLSRRYFLSAAGAIATAGTLPTLAHAQAYPSRPVRWLLGFAPGGTTDIIARIVSQFVAERLGQPLVIEGRPGGGTNIATEAVVRSPPDGYTLLFVGAPNAINATLYARLNFNFVRDIAPVAALVRVPSVLVVHPSVPVATVPELIAYAKANPGKLHMASSGVGSSPHLAGELFKMLAGVDIQHVPYRGANPAMTDLLAGQVNLYFVTTPSSLEHIRAGRVRGLAVTTTERIDVLPELPTIASFFPGYEGSAWYGVGAPKDTPAPVIETLNQAFNAALADPKVKARLEELGCTPISITPAEFGKMIADETEKWGKVVRFSGAKVE
jgi:tripartite-type tricarboxylate transporter receptor subunit TctC